MSYMEYREVKTPDEILTRLEKMQEENTQEVTLGTAGFFDWLNKEAKDGWRMVWVAFHFPIVTFEREVREK